MRKTVTYWNNQYGSQEIESKHVINGILSLLLVQHQQVKEYNDYWLVAHDLLVEELERNDR